MNRFVLSLVVVVFATSFGFAEEKEKKVTAIDITKVKEDIEILEKAVATYHIKAGKPPKDLSLILPYLDPANRNLTSPWGAKYEYDPKGPKNDGKKPDIWVKTPGGEIIGNFPEPKKDAEKPKEK